MFNVKFIIFYFQNSTPKHIDTVDIWQCIAVLCLSIQYYYSIVYYTLAQSLNLLINCMTEFL